MEIKQSTNSVREAIVNTIAFFDMFDFPLRDFEIHKYLYFPKAKEKVDMSDISACLYNETGDVIKSRNDMFFLGNRESITETRLERAGIADIKLKKAKFAAKLFKLIPWVKMVAVANIIGDKNFREEGDIDIFIITEKNRIWLSRFFANTLMQLLGMRPKLNIKKDKICLSFFLTEDSLSIENLRLSDRDDIYFIYWLASLIPVYARGSIYEEFIRENNWISGYLPNWQERTVFFDDAVKDNLSSIYGKIVGFLFGRFENLAKRVQYKLFPDEILSSMNKSTEVVISDSILKFHTNDRRREFYNKWKQNGN